MTNDSDWVEDVKRWYLSAPRSVVSSAAGELNQRVVDATTDDPGHPVPQARRRPESSLAVDR